jgi:glycosyl-4,4'-diaponeurosporenoate acyltransferase
MQIWHLNNTAMIWVNAIAWFLLHMGSSYVITQLPTKWFNPSTFWFRTFKWEQEGKIWDQLFAVKTWKKKMPDGAAWFKKGFAKKKLSNRSPAYLERFVQETCRGEAAHWILLPASFLFFLWNPFYIGIIMVIYALIANAPCIVIQRYNRPYIQKLFLMASKNPYSQPNAQNEPQGSLPQI